MATAWEPTGTPASPWEWRREEPTGWRRVVNGLAIVTAPGSIWGDFGKSLPAVNTLARPLPEGPTVTVQAVMSLSVASRGQQGGILLLVDDDNWVKLVLEGGSTGAGKFLLGRSDSGEPMVVAKVPQTAEGPFLLQLAVSNGTVTASVALVDADQVEAVRAGESIATSWQDGGSSYTLGHCDTVAGRPLFGLMSHGGVEGCADAAVFHATRIQCQA